MRRSRHNDSHGIPVVTQRNSWKNYIFDADYFEEEKNQTRKNSGTHLAL